MLRRGLLLLQYVAFPLSVLVIWQLCAMAGFVRRSVLPAPSEVLTVWYDLVTGATDAAARRRGGNGHPVLLMNAHSELADPFSSR